MGDNTREYRGVKERGLHVVSQYWLQAVRFPPADINRTQTPREAFTDHLCPSIHAKIIG